MSNFIEKCLASTAAPDDIDDFIDQWHANPGDQSLHGFLGMTKQEYARWLTDDSMLPVILKAHARNQHIDELIEQTQSVTAAATAAKKA